MYKKLLKSTLLAITFSAFSSIASAQLITQSIMFDDLNTSEIVFENIGSITIDSNNADDFGEVSSWLSFTLFGNDIITEDEADATNPFLFGFFEAVIDASNLAAGIEFLSFDVSDADSSNFQGLIDTAEPADNTLDVFDSNGDLSNFGTIAFGAATVVPEPTTSVLFFSGLMALFIKRRKV